jgi:Protein of unknown function (DUF2889)
VQDDADLDGDFDGIDAQPLHERRYRVRSYRNDDGTLLMRGAVRDQKPAGLFIEQDDRPLTIHHMVVDLVMDTTTFEIISARVVFETHPHQQCRLVGPHYDKLVGLSIARGFSAKVRELFGGPRGCSHTTALLLAMAPVAIQSMFSLRMVAAGAGERGRQPVDPPRRMAERRQEVLAYNLNTCHVWAEDGEMVTTMMEGDGEPVLPMWASARLAELGLDEDAWRERFNDG